MALLMLALPADYSLLEVLYLFAGYYAVHVAVLFFTLGAYSGSLRKGSPKAGTWFISFCLAFLLGMQGARGMLVIYGPLLVVEVFRYGVMVCSGKKSGQIERKTGIWVLFNWLFNFLGGCLPISVNVGFSRNIRNGFYKLWEVVIPDMKSILGFQNLGPFGCICLGMLFLNAICILLYTLFKICKKKKTKPIEWVYLVVCVSPVMTMVMVAFTTVESTGRYYFMFLVMLSMAAVMLLARQERHLILAKVMCWGAVGYLMISNFLNLYVPMIKSKEPPENDFGAVVEFLEENEYLSGYATFENANTMTLLSNGKVKVSPVASVEKMDICKWLSSKSWYPPEVPRNQITAYIVTESQIPEFEVFLQGKKIKKAQQVGKFYIYVSDYNYANITH